jgi:hypothetical protein
MILFWVQNLRYLQNVNSPRIDTAVITWGRKRTLIQLWIVSNVSPLHRQPAALTGPGDPSITPYSPEVGGEKHDEDEWNADAVKDVKAQQRPLADETPAEQNEPYVRASRD